MPRQDILLVQGLPPESDYRFKHALIQEAAYENLLRSRRTVLHRRVAEIVRVERDKFRPSPQPSQRCWRITSRRPNSTSQRSNGGARLASKHFIARPMSRGGHRATNAGRDAYLDGLLVRSM